MLPLFDREHRSRGLRNYFDDDDDDGSELFLKLPINVCNFVQLQVTLILCMQCSTCNFVQFLAITCKVMQLLAISCKGAFYYINYHISGTFSGLPDSTACHFEAS